MHISLKPCNTNSRSSANDFFYCNRQINWKLQQEQLLVCHFCLGNKYLVMMYSSTALKYTVKFRATKLVKHLYIIVPEWRHSCWSNILRLCHLASDGQLSHWQCLLFFFFLAYKFSNFPWFIICECNVFRNYSTMLYNTGISVWLPLLTK